MHKLKCSGKILFLENIRFWESPKSYYKTTDFDLNEILWADYEQMDGKSTGMTG